MIAFLKGTVLEKGKDAMIVLAGDVGYLVQVTPSTFAAFQKGDPIRLYVHQVVREDAQDLVGFQSMAELESFWKLIGVSGVGPRMALHLLALGPVEAVRRAIERGDVAFLESAQGVGRKTAQRVVLELKGKLITDDEPGAGADEVVSALENLGYPRAKAREVANGLPEDATTEEKIKLALRQLSR
jgi:Holliday junction DNA helicase RuvA